MCSLLLTLICLFESSFAALESILKVFHQCGVDLIEMLTVLETLLLHPCLLSWINIYFYGVSTQTSAYLGQLSFLIRRFFDSVQG